MKNKRVSIIDQRLAALTQQNQVEALRRAEKLAKSIRAHFETAKKGIVAAITGGYDSRVRELAFKETLKLAIRNAKQVLLDNFGELAYWYHARTVDAYLDAIPHRWLAIQLPEAEQQLIEGTFVYENAWLNFKRGVVEVSSDATEEDGTMVFGIPIDPIQLPELTDEEKISVIRDVLFPPPSRETVDRIIETPDAQTGIHWTDRFEALSHKITDKTALFNQLSQGYADGENLQQLTKRVDPLVSGIRSSAMRIARTEGLRVAERIQRESWNGLGDLMIGAQILAVLDENTRPHHSTRNGTIYYRDPPPGEKSLAELPDLPDEPNCRCWSKPVLSEPEELKADPAVKQAARRKMLAGVPEAATQDLWFKNANESRRMQVVGVGRYRAVQSILAPGEEPEWADFIDPEGRLLPIATLKAESPFDRQMRKASINQEIRNRRELIRQVSGTGFVRPPKQQPKGAAIHNSPAGFPTGKRVILPGSVLTALGKKLAGNLKALTKAERQAIHQYVTSSTGLNTAIRTSGKTPRKLRKQLRRLEKAIEKAGEFPEPLVLWRGVPSLEARRLVEKIMKSRASGRPFSLKGIQSFSLASDIGASFSDGNVIIELLAKRGAYISELAGNNEFEVIQSSRTSYRLVRILHDVEFEESPSHTIKATVVQLEEL